MKAKKELYVLDSLAFFEIFEKELIEIAEKYKSLEIMQKNLVAIAIKLLSKRDKVKKFFIAISEDGTPEQVEKLKFNKEGLKIIVDFLLNILNTVKELTESLPELTEELNKTSK